MLQMPDGSYVESPVNIWFGLTYSSYFVMPRLALEGMPLDWQERFVTLMNEGYYDHKMETPNHYEVRRRGKNGKYINDPWSDYRRGSVADAMQIDSERGTS